MSKDPRDEMQPQPEDDDETLRQKLRAKWGVEGARKLEASLQDPAYLDGVRQNLIRQRENVGRPPSPGKKPHGFNTAQFEFAKAIVDGKIQVIRGPNADAVDEAEMTQQVSGEREIERSGEIDPAVAKAVAALSARQHETVEGLGQLGATKPLISAHETEEMSTLKPQPKAVAMESDEVTVPGGRYADDPQKHEQAVRVEPKGSVATAALGVMQTDATPVMSAPAPTPESPPPSSAWSAGAKPKVKVLTDRVATVDPTSASALAAGIAAPVSSGLQRRVTERLPVRGAAESDDAPEVPLAKGSRLRLSAMAVIGLVVAVLGYVALHARSESSSAAGASATATEAAPTATAVAAPTAAINAAPVEGIEPVGEVSGIAKPPNSVTAEASASSAEAWHPHPSPSARSSSRPSPSATAATSRPPNRPLPGVDPGLNE